MKKIKLYDYQQDMLRRIIDALTAEKPLGMFFDKWGRKAKRANSVMVQMPTGTGKTVVMAAVVKWFLDHYEGDVWIVAHRKELVEQAERTVSRFLIAFGFGKLAERVKVYSVQWLNRHIRELSVENVKGMQGEKATAKVGLIVVDEAHHAIADSYQNIFELNPTAMKIGMTATPCRMKKQSFGKLFGSLLTSPPTRTFIDQGYLAPYDYVVVGKYSTDQRIVDSLKTRGSDGDYAVKEMDEKLNVPDSIKRLYQSVMEYAKGRKGIVFAIDILHAQVIARYYEEMGLRVVALDSTTPAKRREEMVEAFRKGKLDCLVNVNLFDEGFDCPDVEYIQMARPTLSLAKYMQMVGRGLRINHENRKKVCMIIDNVGNYRKFGLPDKERNWAAMYAGLRDGKGVVPPSLKVGLQVVGSDMMVTVKRAGNYESMTDTEKRKYLKNVKTFSVNYGYGLKKYGLRVSKEDVILKPMYFFISDFQGDYAVFQSLNGYWGVLTRTGKVVVPPRFDKLELLPRGRVRITDLVGNEKSKYLKELITGIYKEN